MKVMSADEIKSCELGILDALHEYCTAHGFVYYLYSGTLIGAIRHNGFIPWDDDIDVAMLRKDYDAFIRSFQADGYSVYSCETCAQYPYPFAKIVDQNTLKKEEIRVKKGFCIGVDVDIFPLDQLPDNPPTETLRKKYTFLKKMFNAGIHHFSAPATVSERLKNVSSFFLRAASASVSRKVNKEGRRYSAQPSGTNQLMCYADFINSRLLTFQKDWFSAPLLHSFEQGRYYIPNDYDAVLRACYGNYMELPPVEERVPCHTFTAFWRNADCVPKL